MEPESEVPPENNEVQKEEVNFSDKTTLLAVCKLNIRWGKTFTNHISWACNLEFDVILFSLNSNNVSAVLPNFPCVWKMFFNTLQFWSFGITKIMTSSYYYLWDVIRCPRCHIWTLTEQRAPKASLNIFGYFQPDSVGDQYCGTTDKNISDVKGGENNDTSRSSAFQGLYKRLDRVSSGEIGLISPVANGPPIRWMDGWNLVHS